MRSTLFALFLVFGTAVTAESQVRLQVPEENQGPFYARLARTSLPGGPLMEHIYHNDQWAAIAFYRDTACIPADFNLLQMFDFTEDPVYGLRPFGCALSVQGFEIWEHGPGTDDLAPIHSVLRGRGAVGVWFVSWSALQAQVADGYLSIAELSAMPSLRRGIATQFSESLSPFEQAQVGHIALEARGVTEDGYSFQFHATVTNMGQQFVCCSSDGKRQEVIIRFR